MSLEIVLTAHRISSTTAASILAHTRDGNPKPEQHDNHDGGGVQEVVDALLR